MNDSVKIKERVQKHYTQAITTRSGCCGPTSTETAADSGGCCGGGTSTVQLSGYRPEELQTLPDDAVHKARSAVGTPSPTLGWRKVRRWWTSTPEPELTACSRPSVSDPLDA